MAKNVWPMLDKLNEKWFKVNEWKYGHLLTKQYGTSLNVSKIILNVSITLPLNFLSVWTIFKSLNITWISFQCNSITLAFTEMYLISLYFFLSFKTIVSKSCYWQILVQRLLTANLFWESALKKKRISGFPGFSQLHIVVYCGCQAAWLQGLLLDITKQKSIIFHFQNCCAGLS